MEIYFRNGTVKSMSVDPQGTGQPDDSDRLRADFLAYVQSGEPLGGKYTLSYGQALKHVILRFDEIVFIMD
jgi:hypothetical protein